MDKKYNEFRVVGHLDKGKFIIDRKELTERGHVMISESDCETNNLQTRFNNLYYELADEKTPERIALEKEAKEIGVNFRANISDAKLLEKINKVK